MAFDEFVSTCPGVVQDIESATVVSVANRRVMAAPLGGKAVALPLGWLVGKHANSDDLQAISDHGITDAKALAAGHGVNFRHGPSVAATAERDAFPVAGHS